MRHLCLYPSLELPRPISSVSYQTMSITGSGPRSLRIFFLDKRFSSCGGTNTLITSAYYTKLQGALIPQHFLWAKLHSAASKWLPKNKYLWMDFVTVNHANLSTWPLRCVLWCSQISGHWEIKCSKTLSIWISLMTEFSLAIMLYSSLNDNHIWC